MAQIYDMPDGTRSPGPTEQEFRAARVLAKRQDDFGELAYQLCRWYRGQVYRHADATLALVAIRNDAVPSQQPEGV